MTQSNTNYLAATFDQTLATLAQLRKSRCVLSSANEGEPFDLRDLAELSVATAKAVDRLIHTIAERGGIEGYENEVMCAVDGNLEFELNEKALTVEIERGEYRAEAAE